MAVDQPTQQPKVPSIGAFFDDGFLIGSEVMFMPLSGYSVPLVRVTYEHQSLDFSFPLPANVLGTSLGIHSIGVSVGVGFNHGSDSSVNVLNYFSIGYVFRSYEGESHPDANTLLTSTYERGRALRLGLGMHVSGFLPEGLSLALDATYDFGTVRRGPIDIYRNGQYSSSLVPTGDLVLPDDIFAIQVGVCYDINL